jgi:anti-sigma B factor antagonist
VADSPELLSIAIEHHEDRMVVTLRGELDLSTAPALADALREANSEIVVDLAALEFIDASGLHVFAGAEVRAERHGDRLVVINASPLAQRMFRVTGLDHLLSGSDAP